MPYVNKPRPYKKEYEQYDGTPAVKKKRAARNKARAILEREGVVHKGAPSVLLDGLEARGLTANKNKFACLGTTPGACFGKPDWLKEPTTIMDKDGTLVQARGIEVCTNPVGEELYVRTHLAKKFDDIRSAILKSNDALLSSSSHANFLAFLYSYQSRFDYWLSTNAMPSSRSF
jgi:hypothetical protein